MLKPKKQKAPSCGTSAGGGQTLVLGVSLPVLAGGHTTVRKSRTTAWRTAVLIAVHLLMAGHILHWSLTGRTVSPVEPSESMYTLNQGHLNAGFLFFAAAILSTAIFGRFLCGWGCHFVAYQDFCYGVLKKIGIKVKPFRSRLLVFAPLALALYMFVWPTVYRWLAGVPAPAMTNHLMKTKFWETFPGPVIAVLTFLVAGMAIVYFLGAKGFCTYACPYGGFFGLADKVAPGRILVTDACEHCGHCTARCTSNVRVHEEVALYGMVVDPGCMKCMDCVSVCPNDALYFGFGTPLLFGGATKPREETPKRRNTETPKHRKVEKMLTETPSRRAVPYDFELWEEILLVLVGLGAFLTFRGLYDQIPMLMAMGMAAMTAYVFGKSLRLRRDANVRWQNLQLRRGGRLTRWGTAFLIAALLFGGWTAHSAAVQYKVWRGERFYANAEIGDEVWLSTGNWWDKASPEQKERVEAALAAYRWADRWGLISSHSVVKSLVWLYLAKNEIAEAEKAVRRLIALHPSEADPYRGLAGILRKTGRSEEAIVQYQKALEADPHYSPARTALADLLDELQRGDDLRAVVRGALQAKPPDVSWVMDYADRHLKHGGYPQARMALEELLAASPRNARAHWLLGVLLLQQGEAEAALAHLQSAVEHDPALAEARYDLGMALLSVGQTQQSIPHLQEAVRLKGEFALAHYNLAVALFMSGKPAEAASYATEAIRLDPNDPDARKFLEMVQQQPGARP